MNGRHLRTAFVFALATSAAAIVGPRFGEWITPDDSLVWQLLPWMLVGACALGLYLWARRTSRPS